MVIVTDPASYVALLFSRQSSYPISVVHILATNFDNYPKGPLIGGLLRPLFGHGAHSIY